MSNCYIVDAVRTPRAKRKGKFAGIHAVDLLTYPLNAIVKRNKVNPEAVQDTLIGCVTQTGEQGWCVGRTAVLAAGWPIQVPATTINRLCGSGQQAVNFAAMGISSGSYDLVVAGGLEHMTRVPMFSDCGGEVSPALQKQHPDLVQQGVAAEIMAEMFKISRTELDKFAVRSQELAAKAQDAGNFKRSIVAVPYKDESGAGELAQDDNLRRGTTVEALAGLKTVFKEVGGVITAGNASAIVDGAATVLLASEQGLKAHNLRPRARIVSHFSIGSPPRVMLTGPVAASQGALKLAKLSVKDIDIWEINEAFAPVPLYTMRELKIDESKVNVNGGGISLGHPLGATGAMLVGMAVDELERSNKRFACVTMCIGLGMGIATIIEKV